MVGWVGGRVDVGVSGYCTKQETTGQRERRGAQSQPITPVAIPSALSTAGFFARQAWWWQQNVNINEGGDLPAAKASLRRSCSSAAMHIFTGRESVPEMYRVDS